MKARAETSFMDTVRNLVLKVAPDAATWGLAAWSNVFGRYECFACGCRLHFWNPREMPDTRWYERVHGGRNVNFAPSSRVIF